VTAHCGLRPGRAERDRPIVAPPRRGGRHLVGSGSLCLVGRLSPEREWFVTTPAILTLRDGRVLAASEGAGR